MSITDTVTAKDIRKEEQYQTYYLITLIYLTAAGWHLFKGHMLGSFSSASISRSASQ